MDKGELVEYGVPHLLLCQESSHLSQLVDQTGSDNANKLREIASLAHNENRQ